VDLYRNGALYDSQTYGAGTLLDNWDNTHVLTLFGGTDTTVDWEGTMYKFAMWNTSLPRVEAERLFDCGPAPWSVGSTTPSWTRMDKTVNVPTASTPLLTHVTPRLKAGLYRVEWSMNVLMTSGSVELTLTMSVNGNAVGSTLQHEVENTFQFESWGDYQVLYLPEGENAVVLTTSRDGGATQTSVSSVRIVVTPFL
jgi:hypothetical protein